MDVERFRELLDDDRWKQADFAADTNNWCRLSNGWYAKLVLSEPQKISLLLKFAAVAKLRFGADWDWNSQGHDDELLKELEAH